MKPIALCIAIWIGVTISSGAAQAGVIFSDNFDTVPTAAAATGPLGGFTVTGGNVDIVGSFPTNYFGALCVSPESTNCVDLDGSIPGQITSTLITLVPGLYFLNFDLNGSQRGNQTSTTVSFASFTNTYVLASGDTNSFSVPITITTSGTSSIVFKSNTSGFAGALLDNVSVDFDSAVPEPGTGLLFAAALGLLFVVPRMRRIA